MTIGSTLTAAASEYPDKPAFIMGDRFLNFREAENLSNRFANAVVSSGCRLGENIAIISQNCIEYPLAYFGIARAGCVSLHLSPRLTREEIEYCLKKAKVKVAVCDETVKGLDLDLRISIEREGFDALCSQFSDVNPDLEGTIDAPSSATYTGGTTGFPKGGLHSAKSRLKWASIACDFFDLNPEEIMANAAPMGHAAGGFIWFQPGVYAKATQVLIPRWNVSSFIKTAEKNKVTATFLVPTQIIMLLDDVSFEPVRLNNLRKIIYGGAPSPPGLIERAQKALPNCEFIQNYGMTEIGPLVTLYKKQRDLYPTAIGRPTDETEWAIFIKPGCPAQIGQIGELCFRGPTLMNGYIADESETKNFFRTSDGWGWTGDLAIQNSAGIISLVGRSADTIISGGINIYPAEIERTISLLSAVTECVAFGIPDRKYGEVPAIALVVNTPTTPRDVIKECEETMASYKIPQKVIFLEEIPKSSAGKVLRTVLREKYGSA